MTQRAPLTWGWVKDWAAQNGIGGQDLVEDDSEHGPYKFYGATWHEVLNRFTLSHDAGDGTRLQLTWDDLQRIADELKVPDDGRMFDDSGRITARITDLSSDEDHGRGLLVLQHRWG